MVSTSATVGDIPTPFLLAGAFAGVLVLGVAFFLWKSSSASKPVAFKKIPRKVVETFDEDEDDDTKRVTVFFGSQTGTAEGFAKNLADEGKARYEGKVDFKLVDLDDYAEEDEIYEQKLKREKLAIFVLATYGDGEPTDNAARFFKWFVETLEPEAEEKGEWLSDLQFCSFGLGNRQYEHFNKVARVVDETLEKFGATRFVETGYGDDDQCIEDDFNAWRELLWPGMDLLVRDPYDETPGTPISYTVAIPEYRVVVHDVGTPVRVESYATRRSGNTVVDAQHPIRSNVAVRKELHLSASDRACTHLEFDITNSGLTYETGDHVGVFTQNYQQNVEDMADILGYSLDTIISLHTDDKMGDPLPSASSLPPPIPGPLALQTALSRYADLLTPPKKSVIITLASFASNLEQAERLKFLASANGKDEYNQYISTPQRTLLEVLSDFDSVKVPLGVFFAAVSARLSPRFYSISSSPKLHPNRIHVTCALVQGPSASGKIYRGVCSTWMKHAVPVEAGSTDISWAPIFVRTSTFRLPTNPKTPIIMVGPGTGLAPFRGFLQERDALMDAGATLGAALFFFGCRTRKEDYIYEEELAHYEAKGVLSKLILAFSREGAQKEYVQHKMKKEAETIWNIVSQGGHFYICGDAKSMARDVNKELHNIMIEQGGLDSTKAEAMAKQMQVDGRYQRDIW